MGSLAKIVRLINEGKLEEALEEVYKDNTNLTKEEQWQERLEDLRESEPFAKRARMEDFILLRNAIERRDSESHIRLCAEVSSRSEEHYHYIKNEIERLEEEGPDALDNDNSSNKSSCFIATAVYGTPFCKELDTLRGFRDKTLNTKPLGKLFVKTYYKVSPPIADFIRERYALKKAVKDLAIQPTVNFVKKYGLE